MSYLMNECKSRSRLFRNLENSRNSRNNLEKRWRMLKKLENTENRTKQSRHKQQTKKVCPFQVVQLFSSGFNLFQLFQRLFPLLDFFKFSGNFWIFHGEHDKRAWKIDCGGACRPSLRGNGRMKKQSKSVWFWKCATEKRAPVQTPFRGIVGGFGGSCKKK